MAPHDRPAAPATASAHAHAQARASLSTSASPPDRALCVVLHDVSPVHWSACVALLDELLQRSRAAGVSLPVTMLVVPRHHGHPSDVRFADWLRLQARHGHELALHGHTHRDDGPPPRGLVDRLLRRVYTDGEGEFAALDQAEAARRLVLGQAWARNHRLPMAGFVAPAWLMSRGALDAVEDAGFDHTATLDRVIALPGRQSLSARSLVFSTRSAWRRQLSLWWNGWLAWHLRRAPVLRLELHPADIAHPAIRRCWTRILTQALHERRPARLSELAARVRSPAAPARPVRGMAA
jgi:uncharacterized protein